jgi:hypothetical protein
VEFRAAFPDTNTLGFAHTIRGVWNFVWVSRFRSDQRTSGLALSLMFRHSWHQSLETCHRVTLLDIAAYNTWIGRTCVATRVCGNKK